VVRTALLSGSKTKLAEVAEFRLFSKTHSNVTNHRTRYCCHKKKERTDEDEGHTDVVQPSEHLRGGKQASSGCM